MCQWTSVEHSFGSLLQSRVFGVVPLTGMDWAYVLLWSFPIIILDEFLKYLGALEELGLFMLFCKRLGYMSFGLLL